MIVALRGLRVLSVTAHPDDEVLGFGATAALAARAGARVTNCFLSGSVDARTRRPGLEELRADIAAAQERLGCEPAIVGDFPNIRFNATPQLELVQFVEAAIERTRPDVVFTHWKDDLNDDHYHTAKACMAAARLGQRRGVPPLKALYLMEVPSSTDWSFAPNGSAFSPNAFCEIGEAGLEAKLEALACYRDVMRPYPHPRSERAIRALATVRGAESGLDMAEAFTCVFTTLDAS